jgi:hypothetical protein
MPEKFCFPPHEGLPDLFDPTQWGLPPTVDGYVEPDLGVTTQELETGWTRAGRITYVGDAGLPTMVFQGLKHNSQNYLYLSFMVRFDTSFSTNDRIVLVFHPSVTNVRSTSHRRIDIRPLTATTGAGTPGDGGPEVITADATPYRIRNNRPEQGVSYYKYNTGANTWDATTVNNVTIRVRSWEPQAGGAGNDHNWSVEIKLPMTTALGGANWIDLTNNFGFYFDLIRVCSSATCTSTLGSATNSQYTFPRANYATGQGLIVDPSGGPVALEQHLTNLADPAAEANWPSWLGEGVVGVGPGSCQGVRFIDGTSGIGTTTSAPLVGSLLSTVDTAVGTTNTFAARLINEMTTPADLVRATFRIAKWGIGAGSPTSWELVPTNRNTNASPPAPDNVNPTAANPPNIGASGGTAELRVKWGFNAAQHTEAQGFSSDRCLWVLLDSASPTGVYFSESSVRRNLSFINLSEHDAPAAINGDWAPPPPGGKHRFLLVVSKRQIVSTSYDRQKVPTTPDKPPTQPDLRANDAYVANAVAGPRRPADPRDVERTLGWLEKRILDRYREIAGRETVSTWIVVNNAYRETTHKLTLDGMETQVFEPAGSFGYAAEHIGPATDLKYDVTGGPELKPSPQGEDAYTIDVPHKGEVIIKTRLEAGGAGPGGLGDAGGCWGLIRKLFKK